ncbi:serine protease [Parasalinivibrio latis]|uniref:S1 family peptidase n=1 Tax=Parasalinivibrio latis TaxID=2952610 RepID=UPI0030E21B23
MDKLERKNSCGMKRMYLHYLNKHVWLTCLILGFIITTFPAHADLKNTIKKIKPSVVGVGSYARNGGRQARVSGTGFVVGKGNIVATNAHVLPKDYVPNSKFDLAVFVGHGKTPDVRRAEVIVVDGKHDLALLKIKGRPVKAMKLSSSNVEEGEEIAFTGFPLGAVLGLYPVTHRGIVSSISPIAVPTPKNAASLTSRQIAALRNPFDVYQLDAVAYPGNSGSAVYRIDNGEVVAVINSVLVKKTKESALTDPTAISYAIPVRYLRQLMMQNDVPLH